MTLEKFTAEIRRFFEENDRLPTYWECTEIFNWKSTNSAASWYKKCLKEGILEPSPAAKRNPGRSQRGGGLRWTRK